MALVPLNLLVTHDGRSSRQHVTCRYKCGDACSKPAPNTSDNEYFGGAPKPGKEKQKSYNYRSGILMVHRFRSFLSVFTPVLRKIWREVTRKVRFARLNR